MSAEAHLHLSRVEFGLRAAVAAGLVEAGLAQRVRLVTRLAETLGSPEAARGQADGSTVVSGAAGGLAALSGEALGRSLGLSRAAVHKHIDQLRSLGFAVESTTGSGYRMAAPFADLVAAEALLPYLLQDYPLEVGREGRADFAVAADAAGPTGPVGLAATVPSAWMAGLPCWYRARCDSTNRVLRGTIKAELPPAGALAVTDHQSAGRGRLDRVWRDEGGRDLMFSVFLRPRLAPGQAHLLSLAAALAVAETLESWLHPVAVSLPRQAVEVKWPNDVMVQGRKVCGILVEGAMDGDRLHWAIAGIGVNVNSDAEELGQAIEREDAGGLGGRPQPVSLREVMGAPVPRAPLLAALLSRLTTRWGDLESTEGRADLLAGLRARDPLVGHPVDVVGAAGQSVLAGEGAGIGPEGQLLVRTPSGDVAPVYAGDVSLRPFVNRAGAIG